MCQENNTTKSRKSKHLEYSERQSIERWFNKDKRKKVEIADLLERAEKTKMCARTIRNNIYSGDIYEIKSTDMIYNKVYKENNNKNRK